MAATTMFIRHEVADYGAWRAVYDSVEGLRQQYGCAGAEVNVDPGNKNDVFIIHRFPTLEQAQSFAASDALREAMHKAGVAGPPRIEFTVEA